MHTPIINRTHCHEPGYVYNAVSDRLRLPDPGAAVCQATMVRSFWTEDQCYHRSRKDVELSILDTTPPELWVQSGPDSPLGAPATLVVIYEAQDPQGDPSFVPNATAVDLCQVGTLLEPQMTTELLPGDEGTALRRHYKRTWLVDDGCGNNNETVQWVSVGFGCHVPDSFGIACCPASDATESVLSSSIAAICSEPSMQPACAKGLPPRDLWPQVPVRAIADYVFQVYYNITSRCDWEGSAVVSGAGRHAAGLGGNESG